jgi:hypothetical protein
MTLGHRTFTLTPKTVALPVRGARVPMRISNTLWLVRLAPGGVLIKPRGTSR